MVATSTKMCFILILLRVHKRLSLVRSCNTVACDHADGLRRHAADNLRVAYLGR